MTVSCNKFTNLQFITILGLSVRVVSSLSRTHQKETGVKRLRTLNQLNVAIVSAILICVTAQEVRRSTQFSWLVWGLFINFDQVDGNKNWREKLKEKFNFLCQLRVSQTFFTTTATL